MGGFQADLNRALTNDLLDIEQLNSLAVQLGGRPLNMPERVPTFNISNT